MNEKGVSKVDINNPLVQAYLLVNEREVETKLLPKMKYNDLEGTLKELAGYEGCRHVIVNFGLANGTWERFEAIVCDGEIKSSSRPLSEFTLRAEVERIVAEVYEFDKELLETLERASSVEVPTGVEEVQAIEQPPIVRSVQLVQPTIYPTDLLPEPSPEEPVAGLKDISRIIVVALKANSVRAYAVSTVSDEEDKKHVLLSVTPEYERLAKRVIEDIKDQLKERGVEDVYFVWKGEVKETIKL